jgi:hypothetical protein
MRTSLLLPQTEQQAMSAESSACRPARSAPESDLREGRDHQRTRLPSALGRSILCGSSETRHLPITRSMLRHRPGLLALMGVSPVLPGAVMHAFGSGAVGLGGGQHFALVAAGALAAAAVLLGIAFSTMTALLAVHGMATPGVLVGPNGVIALAGGASLPAGAGVLALTALPGLRRPRSRRHGPHRDRSTGDCRPR